MARCVEYLGESNTFEENISVESEESEYDEDEFEVQRIVKKRNRNNVVGSMHCLFVLTKFP